MSVRGPTEIIKDSIQQDGAAQPCWVASTAYIYCHCVASII